jgi:hypothetical protein
MTIWDDLYKDLVKSELKQDGLSAESGEHFKTVEAKVDELRRRVCLDSAPHLTKQAALKKQASAPFRLVIAGDAEQDLAEIKSYIAGLVELRRSSIDGLAVMDDVKNKFGHKAGAVREHKAELRDFIEKMLSRYKVDMPAPVPALYNKPEGSASKEDNETFENISDKLKH